MGCAQTHAHPGILQLGVRPGRRQVILRLGHGRLPLMAAMSERELRRWREMIRRRDATRGLLVAFEGPDGSGKTTQRKLFKTWLKKQGRDVVTTKWNSSDLI